MTDENMKIWTTRISSTVLIVFRAIGYVTGLFRLLIRQGASGNLRGTAFALLVALWAAAGLMQGANVHLLERLNETWRKSISDRAEELGLKCTEEGDPGQKVPQLAGVDSVWVECTKDSKFLTPGSPLAFRVVRESLVKDGKNTGDKTPEKTDKTPEKTETTVFVVNLVPKMGKEVESAWSLFTGSGAWPPRGWTLNHDTDSFFVALRVTAFGTPLSWHREAGLADSNRALRIGKYTDDFPIQEIEFPTSASALVSWAKKYWRASHKNNLGLDDTKRGVKEYLVGANLTKNEVKSGVSGGLDASLVPVVSVLDEMFEVKMIRIINGPLQFICLAVFLCLIILFSCRVVINVLLPAKQSRMLKRDDDRGVEATHKMLLERQVEFSRRWGVGSSVLSINLAACAGNRPDIPGFIDAAHSTIVEGLDSQASVLRFLMGAIPSLGFVGTVVGMGDALMGTGAILSDVLPKQQSGISSIALSLGTAFDTTLVALLLSLLITLIWGYLSSKEEKVLTLQKSNCLARFVFDGAPPVLDEAGAMLGFQRDAQRGAHRVEKLTTELRELERKNKKGEQEHAEARRNLEEATAAAERNRGLEQEALVNTARVQELTTELAGLEHSYMTRQREYQVAQELQNQALKSARKAAAENARQLHRARRKLSRRRIMTTLLVLLLSGVLAVAFVHFFMPELDLSWMLYQGYRFLN